MVSKQRTNIYVDFVGKPHNYYWQWCFPLIWPCTELAENFGLDSSCIIFSLSEVSKQFKHSGKMATEAMLTIEISYKEIALLAAIKGLAGQYCQGKTIWLILHVVQWQWWSVSACKIPFLDAKQYHSPTKPMHCEHHKYVHPFSASSSLQKKRTKESNYHLTESQWKENYVWASKKIIQIQILQSSYTAQNLCPLCTLLKYWTLLTED